MSQLLISQTQITFQPKQTMKSIQLTNKIHTQAVGQPIMYKIKTNKIDYVDAKPSCGYISGKEGQNQISVVIRSLNNKKSYTAKLQILYIAHDKITEELVEKNKKHFDINQYNQIYQTIKSVSKNDAKSTVINVTKKIQDNAEQEPIQQHVNSSNVSHKVQKFTQARRSSTPTQKDTVTIEKSKLLNLSLFMLVVGLLIGFWLGCKHGGIFYSSNDRSVNEIEHASQSQEVEYINVQAPSETQQQTAEITYEQTQQKGKQSVDQQKNNEISEQQVDNNKAPNEQQTFNQEAPKITEAQQELSNEKQPKQTEECSEVHPQNEEQKENQYQKEEQQAEEQQDTKDEARQLPIEQTL